MNVYFQNDVIVPCCKEEFKEDDRLLGTFLIAPVRSAPAPRAIPSVLAITVKQQAHPFHTAKEFKFEC